ncbi:aldehyde dehydrogenase family protein, partial [Roseovarius sp.]|uniref:aldehyde dehydrogenase family protein n=1 Tax=Roseovarius sp. TaxID=1486281 RepID=UPI003A96C78C
MEEIEKDERMVTQQTGNFIAGAWRGSDTRIENRNPSDVSDLIGAYAQAGRDDLEEAIAAARAAQPIWWGAGIQKRHDVLVAIGTEVGARSAESGAVGGGEG